MSYYYWKSEPNLWTVGTVGANGHRETDSDHGTSGEAAARVHHLNGGADAMLEQALTQEQERNRLLAVALQAIVDYKRDAPGHDIYGMQSIARAALAAQEGTGG